MKLKIHYQVSSQVSLCGRFVHYTTKNKTKVTCKDCLRIINNPKPFYQEFLQKDTENKERVN